jgi:hypothetical protein
MPRVAANIFPLSPAMEAAKVLILAEDGLGRVKLCKVIHIEALGLKYFS